MREAEVVKFDKAAWFEIVKGLGEEAGPAAEAGHHCSAEDEVEFVRVEPFGFGVVDDEGAVGGYGVGLDGGEVDAGHAAGRVRVCEGDGPGAGAAADVEHVVECAGGQGSKVEGAVYG